MNKIYKSILFATLILIISAKGYSQDRRIVPGNVIMHFNYSAIEGAHVLNLSAKRATISDKFGNFYLPLKAGDSLKVSCIGYTANMHIIKETDLELGFMTVTLRRDTLMLPEAIILGAMTMDQYIKQIKEIESKDIFELGKKYNYSKYPQYQPSVMSPISLIYSRYNQGARIQRKLQKNRRRYYPELPLDSVPLLRFDTP